MFRTAYSGLVDRRYRVSLDCSADESMTEQCHAHECDINALVDRYRKTGYLPPNLTTPVYMDCQTGMDFQTAMDIYAKGREAFESLPSKIRKEFGNDPARFLDFVQEPENGPALVKMGLAVAPPAPPEGPSPAVAPSAPVEAG